MSSTSGRRAVFCAEEAPPFVDDLDVRRRSQVHNHHGGAVFADGGNGVCDTIRADLCRIVVAHGKPRLDPGPHHNGLLARDALACLRPAQGEHGHYRSDDHVGDIVELEAAEPELARQAEVNLVHRVDRTRGKAPTALQIGPFEQADCRLGVSDVDGEKHETPLLALHCAHPVRARYGFVTAYLLPPRRCVQ